MKGESDIMNGGDAAMLEAGKFVLVTNGNGENARTVFGKIVDIHARNGEISALLIELPNNDHATMWVTAARATVIPAKRGAALFATSLLSDHVSKLLDKVKRERRRSIIYAAAGGVVSGLVALAFRSNFLDAFIQATILV